MKIIIEFNMPEDGDKYRNMINSGSAWDALQQIHCELRNYLKHDGVLDLKQIFAFVSETLSTADQGFEL